MTTWRLRFGGQVQGVGFRPFVWKAAQSSGLQGWVANGPAGVEVRLNADEPEVHAFYEFILKNAPQGSLITWHSMETAAPEFFDRFSIRESSSHELPLLLLPPDVAVCADCLNDLRTAGNRRYRYAFTTCTSCGPRYSIMDALPYDRENTSMRAFAVCTACAREYSDPNNARFYAQTVSCPHCGVQPRLTNNQGAVIATNPETIWEKTVEAWSDGQIVAIKGIGGYLLTCDATNASAVQTLRERKNRPTKPFALMYPNIGQLEADVVLEPVVRKALQSAAAPIVLVEAREKPLTRVAQKEIAPGLDKLGTMLPCAPLFVILLEKFGKPIVATSGNLSQAPIVYRENDLDQLADIADFFLQHNREIVTPQDDSVVTHTASGTSILLRRSRGLAPNLLVPGLEVNDNCVVALGAELKGCFTLTYRGNLFVSPYLGDLSDFDTQQRFRELLERTVKQFQVQPTTILGDLHPAYFTSNFGAEWAADPGVTFRQFQHHEAHFAAVLAENELIHSAEPVLGVIWDGTGLGSDGQIWGGEFFSYSESESFRRLGHLPCFPILSGDKMAREPRLSALALCRMLDGAWVEHLWEKFHPAEWQFYSKLIETEAQTLTSSMGRVFDATACLLGLADKTTYEGEAAILLETLARQYFKQQNGAKTTGYFSRMQTKQDPFTLDWFQYLKEDLDTKKPKNQIAAHFHLALVEMVEAVAEQYNFLQLAFSGGVFQNALLVELLQEKLQPPYRLYFHKHLSPNDECISFGQLILNLNK